MTQLKKQKLIEMYGETKALQLITKKIAKGLFEEDEDFPGDPEEYWFWHKAASESKKVERVSEVMALESTCAADQATAETLVKKGGFLDMVTAGPALEAARTTAPKKRPGKRAADSDAPGPETGSKPPKDETPLEKAIRIRDAVNNDRKECSSYALELAPYKLSSEIVESLRAHSAYLEKAYIELNTRIAQRIDDAKAYEQLFKDYEAKREDYRTHTTVARGMCAAVKKARKEPPTPSVSSKGSASSKGKRAESTRSA
jgi:hypothetical protein